MLWTPLYKAAGLWLFLTRYPLIKTSLWSSVKTYCCIIEESLRGVICIIPKLLDESPHRVTHIFMTHCYEIRMDIFANTCSSCNSSRSHNLTAKKRREGGFIGLKFLSRVLDALNCIRNALLLYNLTYCNHRLNSVKAHTKDMHQVSITIRMSTRILW